MLGGADGGDGGRGPDRRSRLLESPFLSRTLRHWWRQDSSERVRPVMPRKAQVECALITIPALQHTFCVDVRCGHALSPQIHTSKTKDASS